MMRETVGTPLYTQVADALREQIQTGQRPGGQRLSTELELTKEFGVSRVTIRKAIALLKDDGLVMVRHGLGTFVRPTRARQVLDRLETLDTTLVGQGFEPITEIVDFAFTVPPGPVRSALDLDEGERVLQVRRLHSVSDGPVGVVDLSIPEEIGKRWSRQDVELRPFYDLLGAAGIKIGPAYQTIRAEAVSKDVAAINGVEEGAPALVCERVTLDQHGDPVVHALFTYRSDRFEFRISLPSEADSSSWIPSGLAIVEGEPR